MKIFMRGILFIAMCMAVQSVFAGNVPEKKKNVAKTQYSRKLPSREEIAGHKARLVKKLKNIRMDKNTLFFADVFIDSVFADPLFRFDSTRFEVRENACKNYFQPCFGLLSDSSIMRGYAFYSENKEWFDSAEVHDGMPHEILLGMFRLETYFGRFLGREYVINSFFTSYAAVPKKRSFAFSELVNFLDLCREKKWNAFDVKGSTEGAIGLPQFLITSYIIFAIDGNQDGVIDLFNEADAILSAANFLKTHGFGKSVKSQKRALWRYNHSKAYVNAVMEYAKRFKAFEKNLEIK